MIAAGITTVEALADMTPEQLEEVPGIGEKTVEKISVAVRHYFGQYEDDEQRPEAAAVEGESPIETPSETDAVDGTASGIAAASADIAEGEETAVEGGKAAWNEEAAEAEAEDRLEEESSMAETPEKVLAEQAEFAEAQELNGISTEDIVDAEDRASESDANDDADRREEMIELDNDTNDTLVAQSQEVSDEVIDSDEHDRG